MRIGFLSMNLKAHTIGGLWAGLMDGLDRTAFDVLLLSVGHSDDHVARRIRARADRYVLLPRHVSAALTPAASAFGSGLTHVRFLQARVTNSQLRLLERYDLGDKPSGRQIT
jgi:hypothetical protein